MGEEEGDFLESYFSSLSYRDFRDIFYRAAHSAHRANQPSCHLRSEQSGAGDR